MLGRIVRKISRIARKLEYYYARYSLYSEMREALKGIDVEKLTMYPGEQRKNKEKIKEELLQLVRNHRESWNSEWTISQYFLCGCDRLSANVDDFVFQKELGTLRDRLNGDLAALYKYKSIAGVYLKAMGINASCSLGRVCGGGLILLNDGACKLTDWLREYGSPVFCKPDDGIQGQSCFRVEYREGSFYLNGERCSDEELENKLCNLIVEPLIIQHADLRQFSPNCVNPLRICTINANGDIKYVSSYICIDYANAYWSNGASCGIMVGINEEGRCITDGFCEVPGMEGRYKVIPGTNIRFQDIVIPGVKEAIELAKAAHRTTPQIFAIGWDVAVTDDGPVIIEGNPDYGPITYELISGIGLRPFFDREFKSRMPV